MSESEVVIAQLTEKLRALGLESGYSLVTQRRMMRVSKKVEQLARVTTRPQFEVLMAMLRGHSGDLEPSLDRLLADARSGMLFQSAPEARPERPPLLQPYINRRQRRQRH